jgi:hypothetical protein
VPESLDVVDEVDELDGDEVDDEDEVDAFSDDFDDPSASEPFSDSPVAVPLFTAARRSLLAQPDPLKWMAGGANALRIGPEPQSGQLSGPGSLTPWMTSKRRPQAAQS